MEAVRAPAGDGQREIQFRMGGCDEHMAKMLRPARGGEANQRPQARGCDLRCTSRSLATLRCV